MKVDILKETIQGIFANSKGILAMDESTPTCNKRFEEVGIPTTEEMRRKYRQLIVTTPGLNKGIGGAILYDETIRQKTDDGIPMAKVLMDKGIIPGIKVDKGAKDLPFFPQEKVTEGLDGLRDRLAEYKEMGARFAKWRGVIAIGQGIPTNSCIEANVHALARYAALCQEADIVPMVEPEVLMDGNHSIEQCYHVTERALKMLFQQLYEYKIVLEGIILKPNMIVAGKKSGEQHSAEIVAKSTVNCFLESVPAAVPAIAFLSGGQSPEKASAHLNAMNKNYKDKLPWILAFSFARAIQEPALHAWKGKGANIKEAQDLLEKHAVLNSEARKGKYHPSMEEK